MRKDLLYNITSVVNIDLLVYCNVHVLLGLNRDTKHSTTSLSCSVRRYRAKMMMSPNQMPW